MASYLWVKGQTYYFNRRVPKDVQAHYKASRIVICLKTSSQVKNERLYLSVFHEREEADAYRSSRYKVRLAKWKELSRRRKKHPNAVEWPTRPTAY